MLRVEIGIGNDATLEAEDQAALLERVAQKIRAGRTEGTVVDFNGNTVGAFQVSACLLPDRDGTSFTQGEKNEVRQATFDAVSVVRDLTEALLDARNRMASVVGEDHNFVDRLEDAADTASDLNDEVAKLAGDVLMDFPPGTDGGEN